MVLYLVVEKKDIVVVSAAEVDVVVVQYIAGELLQLQQLAEGVALAGEVFVMAVEMTPKV